MDKKKRCNMDKSLYTGGAGQTNAAIQMTLQSIVVEANILHSWIYNLHTYEK